jgi:hypothetical protein
VDVREDPTHDVTVLGDRGLDRSDEGALRDVALDVDNASDASDRSDGGRTEGDAADGALVDATIHDARAVDGDIADADGAASDGAIPRSDATTPPAGSRLFPAPDAQGLCADPSLRIRFAGPPVLGSSGSVRIFDASRPTADIARIDMAAATFTETIDGKAYQTTRPAFVEGNDAIFHLAAHSLNYGATYFVTVDKGVVSAQGEPAFAITDDRSWRFSTSLAAPTSLAEVGVASDGSRPFCSLQGALDAVASVTTPVLITVAPGSYHEIIHVTGRKNLTVRGGDRKSTLISWINNNTLNAGTSQRALVNIERSSLVTLENLTIANLTPQGGTQAEALRLGGCDQCVVRSADLRSLQDTLLLEGRVYLADCFVAGNVDFVWGQGVAYFSRCEIKTVGRSGPIVQARNTTSAFGYVFVDSSLTSDSGLTGSVLARIDASVYPGSQVAYVGCRMGPHISPEGWTITGASSTPALRFWEFGSTDLAGNTIDESKRAPGSTRITSAQAATLRDPKMVLGGWSPPP